MRWSTCTLLLGVLLGATLGAGSAAASIPDGQVAVIRATAIDGIADFDGPVEVHRDASVSYDGRRYLFDSSVLPDLAKTKAILIIDRRKDLIENGKLIKNHTQEVRTFAAPVFDVQVNAETTVTYRVAAVGGDLQLMGDQGHIRCRGGSTGPYQVWRIDGIDLVGAASILTGDFGSDED